MTATTLLTTGLGVGDHPVLLQAHATTSPSAAPSRPAADDAGRNATDRIDIDIDVGGGKGGASAPRPPTGLLPSLLTPILPPEPGVQGGSSVALGPLVGAREIFVADYMTGDFSQWGNCQSAVLNGDCTEVDGSHHSMRIVEDPERHRGRYVARFVLEKGDIPEFGGGERSEVGAGNDENAATREGDERWYEWSMKFPEDFANPTGDWFIVTQWPAGNGSPPLTISVSNDGTVDIAGDGTDEPRQPIGPVRRGEWTDYVLHAKFSRDHGTGFVEAWENGEQTVPKTPRTTMTSAENDLKQGIYRDEDAGDSRVEILFSGLRVTGPQGGDGADETALRPQADLQPGVGAGSGGLTALRPQADLQPGTGAGSGGLTGWPPPGPARISR